MSLCPACGAENPEGTKLCVKCATELPQSVSESTSTIASAPTSSAPQKQKKEKKPIIFLEKLKTFTKDTTRDLAEIIWVIILLLLLFLGFWGLATNWKWKFVQMQEARLDRTLPPVRRSLGEGTPAQYVSPESLFRQAKVKYDQDKFISSFELLKRALEIDPTYAKGYFGLGYLYAQFEMENDAVRMYEMAIRLKPDYADAINNLGWLYYQAGNFDDAEYLLVKSVEINASNADYRYNLGNLYYDKGETDKAVMEFEKASELSPKNAEFYNNLGFAYEKLGRSEDAKNVWKKVIETSKSKSLTAQAEEHLTALGG